MKPGSLRTIWMAALCLMTLFALSTPASAGAQATGSISGTVADPTGNVVPHATIAVSRNGGGVSRNLTSDSQGHFSAAGLPVGLYTVVATAPGFSESVQNGVNVIAAQTAAVSIQLGIGHVAEQVTVTADDAASLAAQYSPVETPLDAHCARSEISPEFIHQFESPMADYGEVLQVTPGTFSVSPNGIGLGQDKTYFRGFADGKYDITWDDIPWNDTNSPTHHSWAFFPSQWLGGIDFDRSPGSASTVGPTPFGGSINLLSKEVSSQPSLRGTVAYGSFNTILTDGQWDSGHLFGNNKAGFTLDLQKVTSDGFQTYNHQQRIAGSIKMQYKQSEKLVLTAFSGAVVLDNRTPNTTAPTRAQVAQYGYNYLLNNDPTSPYYYGYNGYHLPTDFEDIGIAADPGHGWKIDVKPYTYGYTNHQFYTNAAPLKTTTGGIDPSCAIPVGGILPCAQNQLNAYRKFGEISDISRTFRFGVFRTGMWYEEATSNRSLYPTDPLTAAVASVPSYRERYVTDSYQPFAEFEYFATTRLSLRGGAKYAAYTQNFKQDADNGKTIGNLGGLPFIVNNASYNSWLPSADANYRIMRNWSVYGQFARGSVIPPTSVFDVKNGSVQTLPKPTNATTYQAGSVVKLSHLMLDGDFYYVKFQNAYSSFTPTTGGLPVFYLGPDSLTRGGELEANYYLRQGFSIYGNATVGKATYVEPASLPTSGWPIRRSIPRAPASPINSASWISDCLKSASVLCGTTMVLTMTRPKPRPSICSMCF